MAIAYTTTGQQVGVATETSGGNVNPLCPSTVNAGDILIAHVYFEGTATTPDTPSGWTLLDGPRVIETTIGRHWIFGKIADGSEDSTAISFGTQAVTTMRSARIYRFTGRVSGSITDLVNGFSATTHSTDPQMPTVTTTAVGALACACVVQNDNNALAAATGMTGGTWAEATAEFVAALTPGLVLQLQTCTPTANPGTVTGGAVAATNDPSGVIGFQIRDQAPVLVTPSGLVHTRAVGSLSVGHVLHGSAVVRTRAIGTAILPNKGLVSWAQFVVPPANVDQQITPTGLTHTRAFGTASVLRGVVTLVPSSTVHSRTVTSPLIIQKILAAAVAHSRAIGVADIVEGVVTITASAVVHPRAIGTALIVLEITPTPTIHTRAFGTATIADTSGPQTLLPQPVVHTRAIGTATVVREPYIVTPSSVTHTRVIGTAIIHPRRGIVAWAQFVVPPVNITILPSSVVHNRAFGTHVVQSSRLTPSSTVHTRAIGSASVVGAQTFFPASTVHARAFGTAFVGLEPQIAAAGLVYLFGDVTFGRIEVPSVVHERVIGLVKLISKVVPTSVVHTRAFGMPAMGGFILATDTVHTRAIGTPQLNRSLTTPSVIHTRVIGGPAVGHGVTTVTATPAVHNRAIGTAVVTISVFPQFISPPSVVRSRNITGPLVTRAGDPAAKRQGTFSAEWGIDTFHPGDIDVEVNTGG